MYNKRIQGIVAVALLAIISIGIVSCMRTSTDPNANGNSDPKTPINVSLREAWFPWAGYAGEVIAQYEADEPLNVNFVVEPGAEDIDPIKMVLGGNNDFGIASAENLILANQKGADLVAVGVVNYKSATCYLTLTDSNIKTVKEFEGRKIGILTGSETETIYRLLVEKNNLNKSSLKEVEAPFDLKSFISTRAYDVRPAFVYDEPISLESQGIKYNMIKPEDYGVKMMGAVYFTTRAMINEHPEKVRAFVNVLAKGWEIALRDPAHAIGQLKKFDKNIDEKRELASLTKGVEYFQGEDGKALFVSGDAWQKLVDDLQFLKKVDASFDVARSFDNSFVNAYHDGTK